MIFNNADNLMLGSSEVDRVYSGDIKVWERGGGSALSEQDIAVLQYAATAYGNANGLPDLQYTDCYWFLTHQFNTVISAGIERINYVAIAIPKDIFDPTAADTHENTCTFTYNVQQGSSGTVMRVTVRFNVSGTTDNWVTTTATVNSTSFVLGVDGGTQTFSDTYAYTNIPTENMNIQYGFPVTKLT